MSTRKVISIPRLTPESINTCDYENQLRNLLWWKKRSPNNFLGASGVLLVLYIAPYDLTNIVFLLSMHNEPHVDILVKSLIETWSPNENNFLFLSPLRIRRTFEINIEITSQQYFLFIGKRCINKFSNCSRNIVTSVNTICQVK